MRPFNTPFVIQVLSGIENYLTPPAFKAKWNLEKMTQFLFYLFLAVRLNKEKNEAAAARSQQLASQGTCA
jgi:hypothetical protein